ncbi:MAG: peptide chain release factor N(5)-glutamine methyltransferase [Candidatus Saccharimonadales bacterium]
MTINYWLLHAIALLKEHHIKSAELDAILLLEYSTGLRREQIFTCPENILSKNIVTSLNITLTQRCQNIPIAYITGTIEFYRRIFAVNHNVLIPRPETEILVELFLEIPTQNIKTIADVGCGSGAIGITLAKELPNLKVHLIDISSDALQVAKHNATLHHVNANYILSDILENTSSSYDAIVANLPYVPDSTTINDDAHHEPAGAIFGGLDGMDYYRRLFKQLAHCAIAPKFVALESLPMQHRTMVELARLYGYHLYNHKEFIQIFSL